MNPSILTSNGTKPRGAKSMNRPSSFNQPELFHKEPTQYLSALVHEVRNPLANINLSIEMLQSLIQDNDMKTYLGIISRSSRLINELVSDLLKYKNVSEVQLEKHSLHQLLDEVLEMAEDRISLKRVTVIKDYVQQDCRVILDRPKIKIGLTNIIVNAIEAMTSGKGQLKVSTRPGEGKQIVHIEDNGCGIKKGNLKNIFKHYSTDKPGGLGIGLAATYDILQANNVGIEVDSEVGMGTRFTLFFDRSFR